LEHVEEVRFGIFPAADQSAEVIEPGEEALDFPAVGVRRSSQPSWVVPDSDCSYGARRTDAYFCRRRWTRGSQLQVQSPIIRFVLRLRCKRSSWSACGRNLVPNLP